MNAMRLLVGCMLIAAVLGAHAGEGTTLVVCAPGYPGNTEQAQPTMDAFAAKVSRAAGWGEGRLGAVYHERADDGVAAMETEAASVALVPLAFFVEYGDRLELKPRLLAVPKTGASEVWTLVAGKGRVSGARSLDGWDVTGRAGFAQGFVRNVVFEAWNLPDSTSVSFTPRVLSRLRKAAAGEDVAVLLDGEQGAALSSLPFASDLEVVFESRPLPPFVVSLIGDRLSEDDAGAIVDALLGLGEDEEGAAVLEEIRVVRFESLTPGSLESIEEARKRSQGHSPSSKS